MPVHVVWSRAEDFQNSFVRPPTHHILRASLTADGRIDGAAHTSRPAARWRFAFLPAFAGARAWVHDFGAWRGRVLIA